MKNIIRNVTLKEGINIIDLRIRTVDNSYKLLSSEIKLDYTLFLEFCIEQNRFFFDIFGKEKFGMNLIVS